MGELIGITIAILGCMVMCMCLKSMCNINHEMIKELKERMDRLEGKS